MGCGSRLFPGRGRIDQRPGSRPRIAASAARGPANGRPDQRIADDPQYADVRDQIEDIFANVSRVMNLGDQEPGELWASACRRIKRTAWSTSRGDWNSRTGPGRHQGGSRSCATAKLLTATGSPTLATRVRTGTDLREEQREDWDPPAVSVHALRDDPVTDGDIGTDTG